MTRRRGIDLRSHRAARRGARTSATRPRLRLARQEDLEARLTLDAAVVFNEISYHPPSPDAAVEASLEWIEITNQLAVDVDLSDWRLSGGVDFRFPVGTIMPGGGYLVVAASPAALEAASGFAGALGPFVGRLANSGERLELRNNSDRPLDVIEYSDDGAWPVGPDGSGFTLAKRHPNTASDVGDNWMASELAGGTPGRENVPAPGATMAALHFNELAIGGSQDFAIELANFGATPIDVGGLVIAASTAATAGYVLPAQTVSPGGLIVIGQPQLGFTPQAGDKLFLYSAGKQQLLDAATVRNHWRGRMPDGAGEWLIPSESTLGLANRFALHDEVVINEIMYHHQPVKSQPEASFDTTPIPLGSDWKYDASGVDRGEAWRQLDYDDAGWSHGQGVFAVGPIGPTPEKARAGALRFFPISGDADSDISASKTYTHTLDFGTGAAAVVNGVAFTPVTLATIPDSITTNLSSNGSSNALHKVTGKLADLLTDSMSGPGATTVTLNDLVPGQSYDVRLYTRRFSAATRLGTIAFDTDGVTGPENAIVLDEANAQLTMPGLDVPDRAYVVSYIYRAESPRLTISLTASNAVPWLLYGITNETTSRSPIGTLFSSGLSETRTVLAQGQLDPHYVLTASAQSVPPPPDIPATVMRNHTAWYANDVGSSWIGAVANGASNVAAGSYQFRTTFDLSGFDPATASVTMAIYVDNLVADVLLNGVSTGLSAGGFSSSTGTLATLSRGFRSGLNTLEFVTVNLDGPGANPGGFRVNLSGSAAPLTAATTLPPDATTSYFRRAFDFDGDPAATTLSIEPIVDDGAVFYLNGQEVYRQNMPDGPILHGAPAKDPVGGAVLGGPITIPASALRRGQNVLAVEVHQADPHGGDAAFGMTLRAHTIVAPARAFQEDAEAWIELYNRSERSIDLSGWRIDEQIDFQFAAGTRLAPHAYLVVAKDPIAMAARWPGVTIVGPFQGNLSRSNGRIVLRDPNGNPADEVHFYDGGRWAAAADGGGSSLELRDPQADNSQPQAWAASDESTKSGWRTYSYSGVALADGGPVQWNELVMGLLGDGEVWLDDLSVIDRTARDRQMLQNMDFEAGLAAWRIIGNHKGSQIEDPTRPGNHLLRLVATGPTEHMHNHAETTFVDNGPIVNGHEYAISFRAKWISGSNQLNTRLYFNRLAQTTIIDAPQNNGTPGAQNSRFVANIGPTFTDLAQSPLVPAVNAPVTVSVAARDPDGVTGLTLWYSVRGAAWQSLPMTVDAAGRYAADIPGQSAGAVVQFYVEGADSRGAVATYPAAGRNSRAMYQVNDNRAVFNGAHNVRIVTTPADTSLMFTNTNVMSNDDLGATIIYDEREVYYDSLVRLKSSQRGRLDDSRVGFHITFAPDQLFRGAYPALLVDRSGGYALGGKQDEIIINQALNRAGGIPAVYMDLGRVLAPRASNTGTAILLPRYEDGFIDEQYANGGDGTIFEQELIYYPTTTVDGKPQSLKLPQPDNVIGVDISNQGPNRETYRWHYIIKNHRDVDDYSRIIAMGQALSLSGAEAAAAASQVLDVDEVLRMFAIEALFGVADTYSSDNAHNLMFYVRPEDQRVLTFPWDWDFGYTRATNAPLQPGGNVNKLLVSVANQRLFWSHVQDLLATSFNADYLNPLATRDGVLVGQNYRSQINYVRTRSTYAKGQLPAKSPFEITTNAGADFATDQPSVVLEGKAWIDVRQIQVDGRPLPLELTWTGLQTWKATLPLRSGVNALTLRAFDRRGNAVGSDTIAITTSAAPPSLVHDLRISEVMYHPADPPAGSLYRNGDFEYLELRNVGAQPLELAGVELAGGVTFAFPQLTLEPGAFVLVVKNRAAFESLYGAGRRIAGEFAGRLANDADLIVVQGPNGEPIQDFIYDANWRPATDGAGPSLVTAHGDGASADDDSAAGWRASALVGGSPGAIDGATPLFVTNANDSGPGSLRQALIDAGQMATPSHAIAFESPGPDELAIVPLADLPDAGAPLVLEVPAGRSVRIGAADSLTLANYEQLAKQGLGVLILDGRQSGLRPKTVRVNEGVLTLASDLASAATLVVDAALRIESTQHWRQLSIGGSGEARFAVGGQSSLIVDALTIAAGGRLDLADQALVVQPAPDKRLAALAALELYLKQGFHAAAWDGPGITSSVAAADKRQLTAIGLGANVDSLGRPIKRRFAGEPVDAASLLLRYTYYGDASLDGRVDGADYAFADNGFNFDLRGWPNGDFNFDGVVGGSDYALLDNGYNFQGGPLANEAGPVADPVAAAEIAWVVDALLPVVAAPPPSHVGAGESPSAAAAGPAEGDAVDGFARRDAGSDRFASSNASLAARFRAIDQSLSEWTADSPSDQDSSAAAELASHDFDWSIWSQ